jgi:hypothetical protein
MVRYPGTIDPIVQKMLPSHVFIKVKLCETSLDQIFKHSYTEMQKSNKSTVPLLEFMLSAPIGFSDEEGTVNFYGR